MPCHASLVCMHTADRDYVATAHDMARGSSTGWPGGRLGVAFGPSLSPSLILILILHLCRRLRLRLRLHSHSSRPTLAADG